MACNAMQHLDPPFLLKQNFVLKVLIFHISLHTSWLLLHNELQCGSHFLSLMSLMMHAVIQGILSKIRLKS